MAASWTRWFSRSTSLAYLDSGELDALVLALHLAGLGLEQRRLLLGDARLLGQHVGALLQQPLKHTSSCCSHSGTHTQPVSQ